MRSYNKDAKSLRAVTFIADSLVFEESLADADHAIKVQQHLWKSVILKVQEDDWRTLKSSFATV